MDLISREGVLTIATSSCLDLDSYDDTEEFCNEVKEIPSAFEGMTFGETIKTIIPNIKTNEDKGYALIHCWIDSVIDGSTEVSMVCRRDWWNAPYKGVRE